MEGPSSVRIWPLVIDHRAEEPYKNSSQLALVERFKLSEGCVTSLVRCVVICVLTSNMNLPHEPTAIQRYLRKY